jgi:hypothetical protein
MKALRFGILLGVLIAVGLVLYGLSHFPSTSTRSLLGAIIILLLYGLIGWRGPAILFRQPPIVATVAISLGLFGGAVFAGEVILEYVVLPADNTRWGLVEFGLVFLVYFTAGLLVAWRRLPLRSCVTAGTATAIISSLIWFIAVLACFYVFLGTESQSQVFRAEGNYDDFRRSGMADFPTFMMEDFFGAGFFHLLLGPLIAAILASMGGLIGMGLARLRNT